MARKKKMNKQMEDIVHDLLRRGHLNTAAHRYAAFTNTPLIESYRAVREMEVPK